MYQRLNQALTIMALALLIVVLSGCITIVLPTQAPQGPEQQPVYTSQFTVQVQANQGWQDTGISIAKGNQVSIQYVTGLWFTGVADGGGHDASGGPNAWICALPECHEPLHDFPKYALIGRVGDSDTLLRIRNGLDFVAEASGKLYLRPNYGDIDIPIHNPEGAITVKVTMR